MKRKKLYSMLLLCTLAMLPLNGCSGEQAAKESNIASNTDQGENADYFETELSLPTDSGILLTLNQLSDGTWKGVGTEGAILSSQDGGTTWETQGLSVIKDGNTDKILEMASVSKDGGMFLMLGLPDGEKSETEHNHLHEYYYINKDGEAKQLELNLPQSGDSGRLIQACFASDTEVLAWYQGDSSFYRISMEDGSCEKLFAAEQGYRSFCYTGREIISDAGNSLFVYDMESGTTRTVPSDSQAGMTVAPGADEDHYYQLKSQGISLCSTKNGEGSVVVNGNTNAMGNPALTAAYFIPLDNGDFVVVFWDDEQSCRIMKYSRDSEGESGKKEDTEQNKESQVKKETDTNQEKDGLTAQDLEIYILNDSELIRLAIDAFQAAYPDVKVSLEIGMTGEDAVTVSDAIKTLNTEIMSGEGPDLIFLDDLPVEDYIEKGVLEDISAALEEIGEGALYEKIVNTYEKDGNVYAIPARFGMPVLLSEGGLIKDAGDLTQAADAVERYQTEGTDLCIVEPVSAGQMLEAYYDAYASGFYEQNGELNEEGIASFFREIARIYEVRKKTVTQQERNKAEVIDQKSTGDEFCGPYSGIGKWLDGKIKLSVHHIYNMNAYGTLTSLVRTNSNITIQSIGNVYIPMRTVGMSAKSDAKEAGLCFIEHLLSREVQESSSFREDTGFPVNIEALTNFERDNQQENGSLTGERFYPTEIIFEGEEIDSAEEQKLDFYWPSDEEYQALEEMFRNLAMPYQVNEELKAAVLEKGCNCLDGVTTPEKAAQEAVQTVRLQLIE